MTLAKLSHKNSISHRTLRSVLLAGSAALTMAAPALTQEINEEILEAVVVEESGMRTTTYYWEADPNAMDYWRDGSAYWTPTGRCISRTVTTGYHPSFSSDTGFQVTHSNRCGFGNDGVFYPDLVSFGRIVGDRANSKDDWTTDRCTSGLFGKCNPEVPYNEHLLNLRANGLRSGDLTSRFARPMAELTQRLHGASGGGAAQGSMIDLQPRIVRLDTSDDSTTIDSANTFSNVVFVEILTPSGGSTCTGTLINRRQILTAAHCFADAPAYRVRVSFDPESQDAFFDAMSVTLHSEFTFTEGQSDVAIITLDTSALLATPVQLDDALGSAIQIGDELTIVGYGTSGIGSEGATVNDYRRRYGQNVLDYVGTLRQSGLFNDPALAPISIDELFLMADFDAHDSAGPGSAIPGEVITSTGDSGGPAFVETENGLVQVGITSFGLFGYNNQSGSYGAITLFQPVFEHIDWIEGLNPFVQAHALAGDADWWDASHWAGGVVPISDFRDEFTEVSTAYGTPEIYEVHLGAAGTTTVSDIAYVDMVTVSGDAGLEIGADALMWLDTGLVQQGGNVVLDGVLAAQTLQLQGGNFHVTQSGEYFDFSPYFSEGIYQTGSFFRIDGVVTTDWFYQNGGFTWIGETGELFDWDGTFVEGGFLTIDGVLDTDSFAQSGGSTIIGGEGLLFDSTGRGFIQDSMFTVNGVFDTLQPLFLNSTLSGGGLILAPMGVYQVGGSLLPGAPAMQHAPDVLSIDGDYTSDGVYFVVGLHGAGSDALSVSGEAVLDGTLGGYLVDGYRPLRNSRHVFVSTGAGVDISGLSLESTQLSPVISFSLGATELEGYIQVDARDYVEFAKSDQQRALAGALDAALANGVPRGDLAELSRSLDYLSSETDLRAALQSANPSDTFSLDRLSSGLSRSLGEEISTRAQLFASGRHGGASRHGAPSAQLASADSEGTALLAAVRNVTHARDSAADAGVNDRTGLFFSTRFEKGDTELANGVMDIDAAHILFGVDYDLNGRWMIGAVGGFSDYSASHDAAHTQGEAATVGAYAAYANGRWYGHAYAGAGQSDFDLTRTVQIGNQVWRAQADVESDHVLAGLEIGAQFELGEFTMGPAILVRHGGAEIDAYQEVGAGGLNASVTSRETDQTLLGLSWRMEAEHHLSAGQLGLNGELGWRQDISDSVGVAQASLSAASQNAFMVVDQGRDDAFAVVAAGASLQASERVAITARIRADLDRDSDSEQALNFAMSWRF